MLIPPFLFLEPVQVVHHLSEGRSMFGLVRWLSTIVAVVVILVKSLLGSKAKRA